MALAAAGCASAPAAPPHALLDGRYAMGTVLEVTLHGPDAAALDRAGEGLFETAARLDRLLSRHRPDSDVSRVNAAAGGAPVAVAPEVAELVSRSLEYASRSRGSFDVTVGPLVAVWTRAAERDSLPTDFELAEARARVGPSRVRVGPGDRVALEAGASIDLGGIAKGFALDRMLPLLRDEGVSSALLSFGQSSVWAIGAPPDGEGWRLLVRSPDGGFAGIVALRDLALSVSGSLGQWSEIRGRRFGHVLDPRSGWPLTRAREAVVVARDAALAEVLSKALLILGEEEGIALVASSPDCEALLLDADGRSWSTPGWQRVTSFEPAAGATE
jgi:thiamine biosynthesis lipoprotein